MWWRGGVGWGVTEWLKRSFTEGSARFCNRLTRPVTPHHHGTNLTTAVTPPPHHPTRLHAVQRGCHCQVEERRDCCPHHPRELSLGQDLPCRPQGEPLGCTGVGFGGTTVPGSGFELGLSESSDPSYDTHVPRRPPLPPPRVMMLTRTLTRSHARATDHPRGHHRRVCPCVPDEAPLLPGVPRPVPERDALVQHLRQPAAVHGE
jgi:hypothetical protein